METTLSLNAVPKKYDEAFKRQAVEMVLRGGKTVKQAAEEPDRLAATMREVLTKSLTLRGFINYEFAKEHYPQFSSNRIESDRGRTGPLSRRHHLRAGECAGSLHRDVGGTQLRQGARPSGVVSRLLMLMFALELQRRAYWISSHKFS
jgi:hypothetical protein